jgi:hypothetical protein
MMHQLLEVISYFDLLARIPYPCAGFLDVVVCLFGLCVSACGQRLRWRPLRVCWHLGGKAGHWGKERNHPSSPQVHQNSARRTHPGTDFDPCRACGACMDPPGNQRYLRKPAEPYFLDRRDCSRACANRSSGQCPCGRSFAAQTHGPDLDPVLCGSRRGGSREGA